MALGLAGAGRLCRCSLVRVLDCFTCFLMYAIFILSAFIFVPRRMSTCVAMSDITVLRCF